MEWGTSVRNRREVELGAARTVRDVAGHGHTGVKNGFALECLALLFLLVKAFPLLCVFGFVGNNKFSCRRNDLLKHSLFLGHRG